MHEAVHIVLPGQVLGRAQPRARETVAGFLRRARRSGGAPRAWATEILPTVVAINGEPVLRAEWRRRRIRASDRLVVMSRPLGGSRAQNKQVLGLVALVGLSLLAPGVGTWIAGLGLGISASVGSAAFLIGGSFLVSTVVKAKAGGQDDDAGQVYSFAKQANSARLLQSIPVSYGRVKRSPDYAAVPWSEYIGNDEYLNILLSEGCGRYSREQILMDDTILWDAATGVNPEFTGVSVAFYEPGEEVTLFPVNVYSSPEVSGQELPKPADGYVGGFISAPAATTTTDLAIDVAAPGGLYTTNSDGDRRPFFVPIVAEYRPVNDLGAPTGGWSQLLAESLGGVTNKPKRWSFKVTVAPGRYEVRLKRTSAPSTDSNVSDTIVWMGLRAFLSGPRAFAGVSTIALRLKATQQLTSAAAQALKVIETRILPVWTGSAWMEQPTRSPAWAFWDMATNTDYGARRSAAKVDLQGVLMLAATAAARGDCFDYEFTSSVGVPEAFDTALATVRAKHRWAGDMLTLVRDEWRAVPSMLLTDRETVRGTFAVDYEFASSDAADAVIVEYVDETTWQAEEVQYPAGVVAENPMRMQIPGIVQRAQAYREAGFHYRQNVYRRVRPSVTTEHDGRLISLGEHVQIQSDLPGAWGAAGVVAARAGATLTLEPAPAWAGAGQHYVVLRDRTGAAFGPVKCARGGTDALCVLDAADLAIVETAQGQALAAVLARAEGSELPTFAHGLGSAWQRRCIALSGAPSGDRVSLTFVVDDPRVHDDDGAADPLPGLPSLSLPKAPIVAGLLATLEQNVLEPVLSASWFPASGALFYRARISYDAGESWTSLPDVTAAELSVVAEPAALRLQVSAVGATQGPWATVDVAAPVIDASKLPVSAEQFTDATRDLVVDRTGAAISSIQSTLAQLALIVADVDAAGDLNKREMARSLTIQLGAAVASFNEQITAAVGPGSALVAQITALQASLEAADASLSASIGSESTARVSGDTALATQITDLTATVGGLSASLNVSFVADVTPAGAIAAFRAKAMAEGAEAGMLIVAKSGGGDPYSEIWFDADRFLITSGGANPKAAFLVDSAGPTPKIYIAADIIADGSITSGKIAAGTIETVNLKASSVTTDKIIVGGVVTSSIAPGAVTGFVTEALATNVPTSFSATTVTLFTTSIVRTAGSSCIVRANINTNPENMNYTDRGSGSVAVTVYRSVGGGAETTVYSGTLFIGAYPAGYAGGTAMINFGGNPLTFEFLDSANISGTATYRVVVGGVSITGFYRSRLISLTEYKR
ncbi:host specificity factor TipJ family phage tail protein [Xanthobacter flavus]|uniref:host specificity factor TipJ family phage tail protein n=1 Tax=Xanthobacter flavus TaxID=281 RepID=UPI003729B609